MKYKKSNKRLFKILKAFSLIFAICLFSTFGYLKLKHQIYEESIQDVLIRGRDNRLKADDLIKLFGKPRSDEIQLTKIYNQGNEKNFNCSPPFRFLGFKGESYPFVGGHFEDSLYFYFDKNDRYCYFERLSL